jgi:hypothetical protein
MVFLRKKLKLNIFPIVEEEEKFIYYKQFQTEIENKRLPVRCKPI